MDRYTFDLPDDDAYQTDSHKPSSYCVVLGYLPELVEPMRAKESARTFCDRLAKGWRVMEYLPTTQSFCDLSTGKEASPTHWTLIPAIEPGDYMNDALKSKSTDE